MSVHHTTDTVTLHHGDCLDVLRELPDASVHAVVTDPPYGLANTTPQQVAETIDRWVNGERDYLPGGSGFMGKAWDGFVPPVAVWDECLRVLKPGGHLLAFAGSRTQDLMALGLRLAGFDIRDSIAWLYGSGFPKSLDVSKAIDKAAGATREVVGTKIGLPGYSLTDGNGDHRTYGRGLGNTGSGEAEAQITAPATPDAATWQGWGTALKPGHEPVVVARKPLTGTVAANVLQHGTGGINVDGCRVGTGGGTRGAGPGPKGDVYGDGLNGAAGELVPGLGRWPANVLLDESQAAALDEESGVSSSAAGPVTYSQQKSRRGASATCDADNDKGRREVTSQGFGDTGGASRFFPTFHWQAKADTAERPRHAGVAHPTVKPLDLMRWLVRLVTPPGGTVLEPFAGSGTTVEACLLEGFACVAIEREATYLPLIVERIHRQTDPVAYHRGEAADDPDHDAGLFGLLDGDVA